MLGDGGGDGDEDGDADGVVEIRESEIGEIGGWTQDHRRRGTQERGKRKEDAPDYIDQRKGVIWVNCVLKL